MKKCRDAVGLFVRPEAILGRQVLTTSQSNKIRYATAPPASHPASMLQMSIS